MKYEHVKEKKQADLNLYYCDRDENLTPGIRYGPVIRDSYIIECCTDGLGSVIINGTEFETKKGDCVILLPGDTIIHTTDFIKPRKGVWCGVGGMKISSYLKAVGINSAQPYAPPEAFDSIVSIIEQILYMKECQDPGAELRRSGLLHILFGEILSHAKKSDNKNLYIQNAINFMEMNYILPITTQDVANYVGLERCYLSTLFKEGMGMAPHSYLTELRIKKACMLIDSENMPINEVAEAVGIEAVNFSRVFKKIVGKTPIEYKKRL